MSYKKLRQTWRYQLLEYLDERIGDNEQFKRLKLWFYTKYTEGFYVHAPKSKKDQDEEDINECVKYITRYTSRPIMAESRIVEYDSENKTVHWFYNRHEDDKRIDVTEPVENFINNVVLHCPNENFKMVRYFGFYPSTSAKEKSPQIVEYTDEELEQFIEDDVLIEMKYESCGYEEGVPDWLLEEFLEIELNSSSNGRRYSCQCPNCNKTMFRK